MKISRRKTDFKDCSQKKVFFHFSFLGVCLLQIAHLQINRFSVFHSEELSTFNRDWIFLYKISQLYKLFLFRNNKMQENTKEQEIPKQVKEIQVQVGEYIGSGFLDKDPNKKRKVFDNIHQFIYFPELIWKFIDTPHFQRLRNIKQVGCLYYVFPGATHSRFEHSLGTGHLARMYIQNLIENHAQLYEREADRINALKTVTLAGLMHDIGHGPYSHTFDSSIIQLINKVDEHGVTQVVKWTHEMASEVLFEHMVRDCKLEKLISKSEIERVIALIRGEPGPAETRIWEFEIISNKNTGIDVDKLDYFRRDAFYLGAKNIYIDHELLMKEARIIEQEICFPTKYAEIVNNIFHSRYKLYKDYYFNIVSRGIEFMICDILRLTGQKFKLKEACESIFHHPQDYMKLSDNILEKVEDVYAQIVEMREKYNVVDEVNERKFKEASAILNNIRGRKLYKFVKEIHYYIYQSKDTHFKEEVLLMDQFFQQTKIIKYINSQIGTEDQDVICVSISDIGFGMKDGNPFKKVGFFKKEIYPHRKSNAKSAEHFSMLLAKAHLERSIKLYIKKDDEKLFNKVEKSFSNYCLEFNEIFRKKFQKEGFDVIFDGDIGKTPLTSPKLSEHMNNKSKIEKNVNNLQHLKE